MRLDNAHAVNLQPVVFKRRPNIAKQVHKITLAVFWRVRFFIPIVVKLHLRAVFADGTGRMVFGWRGDGDKHPLIAFNLGSLLNPGNYRH
ncbi:hypothetical protein D3C80_1948460 [compost metagenome]